MKSNLVSESRPFQTISHPLDITNKTDIMRNYFPVMQQQDHGMIAPPLNQFISLPQSAFAPVHSSSNSGMGVIPSQISTDNKNKKKVVSNLNLNAKNVNKKKSDNSEGSSNKRHPAKKDITKKYIGGKKEGSDKNDGNGGKQDESDDEEEEEEEEDPDAALFAKKKSSMSPAPDALKDEVTEPQNPPARSTLAEKLRSGDKIKNEKEEEKKGPITFDKIILPSRGGVPVTNKLTADNLSRLENPNIVKAEEAEKAKEEFSQDESLDNVSVSVKSIETSNSIIGQYMKVNRTKQRYR